MGVAEPRKKSPFGRKKVLPLTGKMKI